MAPKLNCNESNPCENDGKCTMVENNYQCGCKYGFNGTNCENIMGMIVTLFLLF